MEKIGIFFGSTEGNTERIVNQLQQSLGGEPMVMLHNVNSATVDDLQPYTNVVLACPTWDIGQLQEDWESFIDEIEKADYTNKRVTFVGLGDIDGYPDTYQDALGLIYDRIKNTTATFVGAWPIDGYEFEGSKAVVNGKFLGLCLDEDNEKELTPGRIEKWVAQLKKEFF
jgi:flavodoxin I